MVAQETMDASESLNNFIPLLQTKGNGHDESAHSEQDRRKPASSNIQLPQELEQELARITKEFTVDTAKLKVIVKNFGDELDEGLKKSHQNIVRWDRAPFLPHPPPPPCCGKMTD